MKEKIIQAISQKYAMGEKKGIFVSGFNKTGVLAFSNGVIETNKTLQQVIEDIYNGIVSKFAKDLKVIVVDIVSNITELTNPTEILGSSPKQYGFLLEAQDGSKSGVLLPNTEGIVDAKHALTTVKQKYQLEGKVKIYRFQTDRIVVG